MSTLTCPLCAFDHCQFYFEDKRRQYQQCQRCELVFVPTEFHLSQAEEKREYDKHQNLLDDPGYLHFLQRAIGPLTEHLQHYPKPSELTGLDFGCGPGPALAQELNRLGWPTKVYDPYFFNDPSVLQSQYDFITCTEVVEHFNQTGAAMALLIGLLKPHSMLVIMTKLVINRERFAQWHYKNDPTHISFFSQSTFEYLASQYQLEWERAAKDVIVLKRGNGLRMSKNSPSLR